MPGLTRVKPKSQRDTRRHTQPPYHVILLDDDDHTYEYVIEMLQKLFVMKKEEAYVRAVEVDTAGRVILDTTSKERAEFKQEQIHGYGRDWRIEGCQGSMYAVIEPAP